MAAFLDRDNKPLAVGDWVVEVGPGFGYAGQVVCLAVGDKAVDYAVVNWPPDNEEGTPGGNMISQTYDLFKLTATSPTPA